MSETGEQDFSFGRGATLIREGEAGAFCYLILSGKVEVFRTVNDSKVRLAELGEGGVVGEMALIDPAPRSASVVAIEPTACRRITGAALDRALEASPPLARFLLQTYIRNIRHAQGIVTPAGGTAASGSGDMAAPILSERNAMRVLDRKVYAMGDVIFRTGQAGYSAFLVQSGRIELLSEQPDGTQKMLRSVGAGEVFGELSLLSGNTRLATAIAREPSACEIINASNLTAVLNACPPVVRALMRIYGAVMLRQAGVTGLAMQS
ncbi:cyclic nucleotide-binding domain-containing protein [Ferrovibrio xuzhouensis]|uniref:Cyclic nucleotide-binding domain-containing protein n=1 Tax=Ferrovibrio xuzhouensis TaxID=1576914 RepID=A0ABV7V9S3_9PROT